MYKLQQFYFFQRVSFSQIQHWGGGGGGMSMAPIPNLDAPGVFLFPLYKNNIVNNFLSIVLWLHNTIT